LALVMVTVVLGIFCVYWVNQYEYVRIKYNELVRNYNALVESAQANSTATTIIYYTNFGTNQNTITLSIPYGKYDAYHEKPHPYWGEQNLTSAREYITSNETLIAQIVDAVRNRTESEEEFADSLLDFVQDKGCALSIRYYPTTEWKYPLEALVEVGGDCDVHSFLYATLMKAAGFDVLLLLSKRPVANGLPHAATAVHLATPPAHSLAEFEDKVITYDGKEYYYAETTSWNFRVGDFPSSWLTDVDFWLVSI